MKLKWIARQGIKIQGFPGIKFIGRGPFSVASRAHADQLLKLGTFEEVAPLQMRYKAPVKIRLKDDSIVPIDSDGFADVDLSIAHDKYGQALGEELMDPSAAPKTYDECLAMARRKAGK